MIGNQVALIRREVWEHRAIWVTPAAITTVLLVGTLSLLVFGDGFAKHIDTAILAASNVGEAERKALSIGLLSLYTMPIGLATFAVSAFYCLDALYAERQDRSILFWRSLPVTDTETVLSKLAVAFFVIPIAGLLALMATQIVALGMASIWVEIQGGSAPHLLWNGSAIIDVWASNFVILFAATFWLAPYTGWFLFVSAIAKRSPFLVAFLPLAVLPLMEFILQSSFLAKAIWVRPFQIPLFRTDDVEEIVSRFGDNDGFELHSSTVSIWATIDLGKFFSSLSFWTGLVVCGLLISAAVYVRRYRDES